MDPATIALLVKGASLGADMISHAYQAYEANKDAFSSQDAAVITGAIAAAAALNLAKEDAALDALDQAAKSS